MYDLSDETTELPPLHEVTPEDSMLALRWVLGAEGVVSIGGDETMPVRYLSLRGLVVGEDGPEYGQVHIALPHHAVRPMLEQWLESLDDTPKGLDPDL